MAGTAAAAGAAAGTAALWIGADGCLWCAAIAAAAAVGAGTAVVTTVGDGEGDGVIPPLCTDTDRLCGAASGLSGGEPNEGMRLMRGVNSEAGSFPASTARMYFLSARSTCSTRPKSLFWCRSGTENVHGSRSSAQPDRNCVRLSSCLSGLFAGTFVRSGFFRYGEMSLFGVCCLLVCARVVCGVRGAGNKPAEVDAVLQERLQRHGLAEVGRVLELRSKPLAHLVVVLLGALVFLCTALLHAAQRGAEAADVLRRRCACFGHAR